MSLHAAVAQLEAVVVECDAEIAVLVGGCDEAVRGLWLERDIAVQAIGLLDGGRVVEPLRLSCSFLAAVIAVVQIDEERYADDGGGLESSFESSFESVVQDSDSVVVTAVEMSPEFDMVASLIEPAEVESAMPKGSGGKYDYAEIARCAREALAEGKLAGPAVRARFGVNGILATQMITRARNAGHDIPLRTAPAKPAEPDMVEAEIVQAAPPSPPVKVGDVLGCLEDGCDWVCDVFEVRKMLRHTEGAHGRRAAIAERTPRPR